MKFVKDGGVLVKKREKKTVKNNNEGFSFIELLLAIVILALVAAPIFRVFLTTSQINNNSKQLMAATDAATVTMEYISACKFSGTGGVETIFTTAGLNTRIPALSFTCHTQQSISYATDYSEFVSWAEIGGMEVGTGDQYVFYLKPDGSNSLGLALFNVPSNGYMFDMIVWFEPNSSTSDKYYTYDVTIDVYEDEDIQVTASDGSVSTQPKNFGTKLITINGAVENK